MAYSPFDKDLKDLTSDDLYALTTAHEGWYVEYKGELPNQHSIAKSISAFANTYGGWLFYGIKEKSKDDAVAGAFVGVPLADLDSALQRIRQAVAEWVNPVPHFDTKAIWGPNGAIGLEEDKAIICIRVQWSPIAPHVHKDGRIYRRVSDSSEPKPESDRFILDQLWRRADETRAEYKKWVKRKPELSEAESEQPFLRLLIVTDPWGDRGASINMSLDEARDILGQGTGVVGAIPFDTVYTCANGYVARQQKNNNPQNLSLTWRSWPDLASEVLLPLQVYSPSYPTELDIDLDGYEHASKFAKLLEIQGHKMPRIVDLNLLFNCLIGIAEIQDRLLAKANWSGSFFVKAQMLNVWRTVPFIDAPSVMAHFEKYGIPMCLQRKATTPAGFDPDTFFEVTYPLSHFSLDPNNVQFARIIVHSYRMFIPIALAFGLPTWAEHEGENPSYYEELQHAGHRAMTAQQRRNARRKSSNQ